MLTGFHIGLHLKFDSLSRSENVSRDVGIFYHTFTHLCAYKVNSNYKYNKYNYDFNNYQQNFLWLTLLKWANWTHFICYSNSYHSSYR